MEFFNSVTQKKKSTKGRNNKYIVDGAIWFDKQKDKLIRMQPRTNEATKWICFPNIHTNKPYELLEGR